MQKGLIYVGTNEGRDWIKINTRFGDKWVSRVLASTHELPHVYVSKTGYRQDNFTAYLYMSDDFSKTCTSIVKNLPDESINVVRENPGNKNILYICTNLGVFVSLDQEDRWHSLCNDLPTYPMHDLAFHPRENELVIGTHSVVYLFWILRRFKVLIRMETYSEPDRNRIIRRHSR